MVNFVDVANGDIFKGSIKLANILDITPDYAKENQDDKEKILYFEEILNAIGRHSEKVNDYPYIAPSVMRFPPLSYLLSCNKYYGLKITAHYAGPNKLVLNSLNFEFDNDINPLMCIDMAIHAILERAGVGIFDFYEVNQYILDDASPKLVHSGVVNELIAGHLIGSYQTLYDYNKSISLLAELIDFTFKFCKIKKHEATEVSMVNKSIKDLLLELRGYIINILKIRMENHANYQFMLELENSFKSCKTVINNASYYETDGVFIKSLVSVLNRVYEENFIKNDIKFTIEDAKNKSNLIIKNNMIKDRITALYLGVKCEGEPYGNFS